VPLLRPRLALDGFWVMFEIGEQADAVMELLRAGFAKVFVMQDLSGRDRVVTARQESPRG
jgi:methylase of polypeptide subunit release factors